MIVVATAKNLNVSPRKIRVLANVFKHENAEDVLMRLEYVERAAAKPLMKVIKSALANAKHAHNLDTSKMIIDNIIVNQGIALKRFHPVARGSAHGYKRRRSHVTVVLEG
jgi:large subunit ribosomal protein L22